ncbi:MAG TPA: glycosyl transferase [Prevotella sp.]|jgi:glycosyltransferase involved in cell wall biosynthesis|nr:glycosyltransferase family 4 protein [uncultured Prevotella sp.]HAT61939.1 glycosyl transferase [Prevotella sp.]
MKILEINVFHYRKGGSEAVYFSVSDLLREHGDKVINFALKWKENLPSAQSKYFPESKETRKGILRPIKNIVGYFYNHEAAKKLEELIEVEKPEIAQIHLIWGQITGSILPVLKRHHIPIVFTIHEYRIVCPAYTFRNGKGKVCEQCKGKYFYKCIQNKCCKDSYALSAMMAAEQYLRNWYTSPSKYADGIIYVSNFAKSKLEQYMPALKNRPNTVLYNLTDNFKSKDAITKKNDKYFLFFGRLSYEKGIKTLITAFKETALCRLKIAGTGPLETELKEFVKNNKMDNVEFLGYQSGKPLQDLVSGAYFIMVPSEWYENNPMTIIEGYAEGVPAIGAEIGGIPEIIDNGRTGYLFESGNKKELAEFVRKANELDDNTYLDFCRNALTFAKEHFDRKKYYPRLMNFFQEVKDKYDLQ